MRPVGAFFLLTILIFSTTSEAEKAEVKEAPSHQEFISPVKESNAYKRYLHRTKNEQSKILYLLDRFLNSPLKVVYDGTTYDSNTAINFARSYVARNYRNENAASWIKIHAYRSNPKRKIIYMKLPNGKTKPFRDALLEELEALEKAYNSIK